MGKVEEEMEDEDLDGVDLYKGNFSLAYGTLTLLRDAKMHLKQNRFYGLLGPNQCGKTTLMRAIVGEKLEGFPKQDELKSVFVEHEIEEEEVGVQDDGFPILSVDKPGWWWVMHTCNGFYHLEPPVTEEICNEVMKFSFPTPGPLEGVKSRSKVVLRMNSVDVQYPTKDKPTIMDVSLTVSQVSRVAVIGANGAGKTTAIKALVGEQMPSKGSIWKAPGLRMAYVAQHAFHHLEKHMTSTPTQYIMWRFA